jgi:hypothetical protein
MRLVYRIKAQANRQELVNFAAFVIMMLLVRASLINDFEQS